MIVLVFWQYKIAVETMPYWWQKRDSFCYWETKGACLPLHHRTVLNSTYLKREAHFVCWTFLLFSPLLLQQLLLNIMAESLELLLPELLMDDFKWGWRHFEFVAATNERGAEKELVVILTLLRGNCLPTTSSCLKLLKLTLVIWSRIYKTEWV